jgi:hypothetical protein
MDHPMTLALRKKTCLIMKKTMIFLPGLKEVGDSPPEPLE